MPTGRDSVLFADKSVDFSRFSVAPDEAWLEQPLFAGQLRPPMGFPIGTDVAARGIHVDDIAHVVNYDLPYEPENFIHRVGRTGRAGARGASWTFVNPLERSDVRNYERALSIQVQFRELPLLPRPIGLVTDVNAFLASMSTSQPSSDGPKPTTTGSSSGGRRRR